MADNTLGSVQIIIRGDWSQLPRDFQAAGQFAAQAGNQISASMTGAVAPTDKLVDEIRQLGQVIRETSAASDLATQRNLAMIRGLQQFVPAADKATFSVRYLFLGLKDLAEGRSTFALAEGANQLTRFGPQALIAGAAVGVLVATFYGFQKAAQEVNAELAKTSKELDDLTDSARENTERVNVTLQTLQFGAAAGKKLEAFSTKQSADEDISRVHALGIEVDGMARRFGEFHATDVIPYFGSKFRADDWKAIIDKEAEQSKILADADKKYANAKVQTEQEIRERAQEAGQTTVARVNQEKQSREAALALQKAYTAESIAADHNAEQVRIALIQDRQRAAVEAAQAELRVEEAKQRALTAELAAEVPKRIAEIRRTGAAEAQGRTAPEVQRIHIETETKASQAQADADQKTLNAAQAVNDARGRAALAEANYERELADRISKDWIQSFEEVKRKQQERFIQQNLPGAIGVLAGQQVGIVQDRGAVERAALDIQRQKIVLEGQYAEQLRHTHSDQIEYARQIGNLTHQEYQERLRALNIELLDVEAKAAAVHGTEAEIEADKQLEEIKQKILNLTVEAANADQQSANAVGVATAGGSLKAQGAAQIQSATDTTNLASQFADSLASGIADGLFHHKGKSIGQALAEDLKKALESFAESAFKQVLSGVLKLGLGFLGFADGGRPPVGVASIVGERGPELFVPDNAGTIIPAGQFSMAETPSGGAGYGGGAQIGELHFHAHGMQNPDAFVRRVAQQLPTVLKNANPRMARYAS